MTAPSPPKLNHVFTLRGHMAKDTISPGRLRAGPHRHITALTGGFLRGVPGSRADGLNAALVDGGSDWILLDESTNTAHLDVRTQGRTKSGSCVYIHYTGYLRIDDDAEKFMGWKSDAKTTEYGKHHWWSAPNIEMNDPEFHWVTTTQFLGRGRWFREGDVQAVEYQIFEVTN